jgi:hypothetical protein
MNVARPDARLRVAHDRGFAGDGEGRKPQRRGSVVERDHRLEGGPRAPDLNEQLEKSTHTLAARNAAYDVLEAEMKLAGNDTRPADRA